MTDAEVERQVGPHFPVVGHIQADVRHAIATDRLAKVDCRVRNLPVPVRVSRVPIADREEIEPTAKVLAAILQFLDVAVQLMAAELSPELEGVLALDEGERIGIRKGVLHVECIVLERAEVETVTGIPVAANVERGQIRPNIGERVVQTELLVGEVRNGFRVVAVAEEAGAELVDECRAKDVDIGERDRALLCLFISLVAGDDPGIGERVNARLVRKKELAAQLVLGGELMVKVDAKLILAEFGRDHSDNLAAFPHLRSDPPAIGSAGARRDQVTAIGILGFEQRPRDRIDDREVDRASVGGPDSLREPVDSLVGAVVAEGSGHTQDVGRLIHE